MRKFPSNQMITWFFCSVENKVGYVRYNFFSKTLRMKDFTSLNQALEEKMIAKRQENYCEKMQVIESLWQEEQQLCLALISIT